jgi:hypothetical protein
MPPHDGDPDIAIPSIFWHSSVTFLSDGGEGKSNERFIVEDRLAMPTLGLNTMCISIGN